MTVTVINQLADLDDPFADRRLLVLLASYRDPELPRTIANALTQAAYPEHIRFAICHQYDDGTKDALDPWAQDPRFSIDAIPYGQSRGCCWARARTYDLYDDEPYILQVDAHTRFAARWDQRFIDMLESVDNKKAILTCYPPSYKVDNDGEDAYQLDGIIHRLTLGRLNHDLTTRQRTEPARDTSAPGPSQLLAAGQIFTRGTFCKEVPYDPEIYFAGEEISLAARAYTSGYDLLYPNQNLIWHRYDHGVPLHWEDNPEEQGHLHAAAVERLRKLLSGQSNELGAFGLGTERSLADFERMAGIDFSNAGEGNGWSLHGELELNTASIDLDVEYQVWVFAVLAENEKELFRDDIFDADVLSGSTNTILLNTSELQDRPTSYILWPVFADGSFGDREVHQLDQRLVGAPLNVDDDLPAPRAVERVERAPAVQASPRGAVAITIDRSIIEPRDDYTHFVVVFLDSQGVEVARNDVRRPDILDLSVGQLTLHDLEISTAVAYAVLPTSRNGNTGAVRVQPLDRP